MMDWLNTLLWQRIFGPRNRTLFRLRIWLRVRWLLTKLWWREDVSMKAIASIFPRPALVLLVGLGVPAFILWLTDNMPLLGNLLDQAKTTTTRPMEWREFVQLAILFVGVPAAFILWAFRDHNVQATLENQRKDVNLKAFQEIQLRAVGALDEKLPAGARETLQIAALNQLRAFLRGEFGEEFRRPAFELLLAMQQSMVERLGFNTVRAQIPDATKKPEDAAKLRYGLVQATHAMLKAQTNAERAMVQVIRSEWRAIWRSEFPLNSRSLDLILTAPNAILSGLHLHLAKLGGANLHGAHLEGAELSMAFLEAADLREAFLEGSRLYRANISAAALSNAHLQLADMSWAQMRGADLGEANLYGARISGADLSGADLSGANLQNASLRRTILNGTLLNGANLCGADLRGARLGGAELNGALFDGETKRSSLINLKKLGAIHISESRET